MVDPGFPVGGGTDLRRVHFLAKTYVKMKEMDPVGEGAHQQHPPGSANAKVLIMDTGYMIDLFRSVGSKQM